MTKRDLFELHGPVMHGRFLYKALGFNSYRIFYEHQKKGKIDLNIFQIENRRGWFAKTEDVEVWIQQKSQSIKK